MSLNNDKPTWKNTLNSELGLYNSISEVYLSASGTGYPFFTWIDGDVYRVVRDYSPKGYFTGIHFEATGVKISDLDSE